MSEDTKFGGHNYKADVVWTTSLHQKANGEIQIDKFKLETGTIDGMHETTVDNFLKLYEYCLSKGLNMVSPFADK